MLVYLFRDPLSKAVLVRIQNTTERNSSLVALEEDENDDQTSSSTVDAMHQDTRL
jgi:hypothetical protein